MSTTERKLCRPEDVKWDPTRYRYECEDCYATAQVPDGIAHVSLVSVERKHCEELAFAYCKNTFGQLRISLLADLLEQERAAARAELHKLAKENGWPGPADVEKLRERAERAEDTCAAMRAAHVRLMEAEAKAILPTCTSADADDLNAAWLSFTKADDLNACRDWISPLEAERLRAVADAARDYMHADDSPSGARLREALAALPKRSGGK